MDRKYGFEEFNEETFQLRLKTQLKSKLFIGKYQSKRLCEQLKCYRDVIEVDKTTESEICNDLQSLMDDVAANARFRVHVGVSKNFDENFSIWTELDEEIAFGRYWFQIKTVKFRPNEVQVRLKMLRSVDDSSKKSSFSEKLRASTKVHSSSSDDDTPNQSNNANNDDAMEQWKTLIEFWSREMSAAMAWFLSLSINRTTIIETLRFVSLVIVSLFAGSTQIVKYMGIFAIKIIERTTWLVTALTPFMLALVDLVTKIFGGLYLLIAMIWRDSTGARRPPPPPNALRAGPGRPREAIRYNNY